MFSGAKLHDMVLAVLAICVLATTGLVVRREFFQAPPPAQAATPPISEVVEWREYARAGQVMGPSTAPVTIVEFSDFQCPFCSELRTSLERVREKYPTQVRIVFRHFPLTTIHPFAHKAAIASECAGVQGRFVEYHDLLYENQKAIADSIWLPLARKAGGIDTSKFAECLSGDAAARRVEEDVQAANTLGVRGTPTVLVGAVRFGGTPQFALLDSVIAKALSDHK